MSAKSLKLLVAKIAEIDRALEQRHRVLIRRRLRAVKMVLRGASPLRAAMAVRATEASVLVWVEIAKNSGISALTTFTMRVLHKRGSNERPKKRALSAKPAKLRALAAKEKSYSVKKRLLALARVADGETPARTAKLMDLSQDAVARWVRRFQSGGMAALRDKTRGRPSGRHRNIMHSA